ncbi:putative HlyD family secretion protein [Listeria monocytogenes]|nr:putative HlyD family secretion protein [Listeria monocytogenes]
MPFSFISTTFPLYTLLFTASTYTSAVCFSFIWLISSSSTIILTAKSS